MKTWIGLNTTLYIRGLGCAPCIAPRDSIQAALSPNWFFMTRKDPVYILRRRAISAAGKPQASKMENIARLIYSIEGVFNIEVKDDRQTILFLPLVVKYAVHFR
jgi:hypothetical protein